MQADAHLWERLDNRQCIQAYSNVFVTDRRNLVLVSSAKNSTNSVLFYESSELAIGEFDNNWWICSSFGNNGGNQVCQPNTYEATASNWTVFGFPVEYCLSEKVQDVCSVEFSMTIMVIVISFNALKVGAMLWVLLRFNAENILTSIGDAAANFLVREDETTRGMCLATKKEINRFWSMPGTGVPYMNIRGRWAQAVSRGRWWAFFLLFVLSLLFILIFGAWGFSHVKSRGVSLSFSGLWQLGFGDPHQDTIVFYDPLKVTPMIMALIANIPQIFLASVWLLYMSIISTMFLASDWARFGTNPQALMTSSPAGERRGTWLLGAPPIYGAALLAVQIILHWLVSQSIFLMSFAVYNDDGTADKEIGGYNNLTQFINCGYSPIAIIFSFIAALIMALAAIAMAFGRFPNGAPPIVGTCSAAISASCHLPPGLAKQDSLYAKLRWGQVGQTQYNLAHCSLMPEDAFLNGHGFPPVAGWLYAGLEGRQLEGPVD